MAACCEVLNRKKCIFTIGCRPCKRCVLSCSATYIKVGHSLFSSLLTCNITFLIQEQVVGFHVVGPNAGEITQGWTVGMRMGATKQDFDASIGIHPTCAEVCQL